MLKILLSASLLLLPSMSSAKAPDGQVECNGVSVQLNNDPQNCGACRHICAKEQSCCKGSCRNLAMDSSNCGICGKACPTGKTCQNGACKMLHSMRQPIAPTN